ncbi:hypothetical protein HELRODRAFT_75829 [Helobdella robusta]|uniref:AB hydrolase-1 domain-containing protein n=1 Tax=Helobdella robusta TaxID=6412 RepID=T1G2A8_HELRO|nr:hypothetical protein HELRODRAFT_75829 [Helobdella robusta]ESO07815.1 hypothetical protein HELRODRAFT_75829 [Helobdella robusta]
MFLFNLIKNGPGSLCNKARSDRPEVLTNNEYGEHKYVLLKKSRMKLHCVVSGPVNGPLLLFVHGFPEFWYSWRHQIKKFMKTHRVVAIDMRGYGESDKPHGILNFTIDKLVADLIELINELGYKECSLVAHDWGGAVAWCAAAHHPDIIKQLIILNCPHPLAFRMHIKSSFGQLFKSWYMFFFQLPLLPIVSLQMNDLSFIEDILTKKPFGCHAGAFTGEDIEAFKYTFAEYSDLCGPVNYYRAAMRYSSLSLEPLNKIKVPTLIIWGTEDQALDTELADKSKEFCDLCIVKYVEGASHWVQQDNPDDVNSLIECFLNDLDTIKKRD